MIYGRLSLLLCTAFGAALVLGACHHQRSAASEAMGVSAEAGEWIALFDGESLAGWTTVGGSATYEVDAGTILGTSGEGPNTYLVSESAFKDFELKAEVKLEGNPLNSGIQVRSSVEKDDDGSAHVAGPQVEIEASPPAKVQAPPPGEAGYIYGEATTRAWLSKERPQLEVFENGDWNTFRIRAAGDRLKTWVNGTPVADIQNPESSERGRIALQVHSVPDDARWQVRWRDVRLRRLGE